VVTSSTLQYDYYRYINAITNVLLTLNSAVNFLIYCLVGKKFRRIFVTMICDGCRVIRCCGGDGSGEGGADGEEEDAGAAAADNGNEQARHAGCGHAQVSTEATVPRQACEYAPAVGDFIE